MKIVTIATSTENNQLGVVTERGILHAGAAEKRYKLGAPATVTALLADADAGMQALNELIAVAEDDALYLKEDAVTYEPCVPHPNKILCIGLNYREHAMETGKPIPTVPIVFSKFNNALNAHNGEIRLPAAAKETDYEAELCIVIGRRGFEIAEEQALSYVFGYCAANDVSARDLQYRTPQWLLGKTPDGFAPIGPYLVTADEAGNPNALSIRSFVNGQQRQSSNTSDMIFDCAFLVSYISRHMTLEPGDLILTGTPAGVVAGYPPEERVYLQDGDVVEVEIEKLGRLVNRVVR